MSVTVFGSIISDERIKVKQEGEKEGKKEGEKEGEKEREKEGEKEEGKKEEGKSKSYLTISLTGVSPRPKEFVGLNGMVSTFDQASVPVLASGTIRKITVVQQNKPGLFTHRYSLFVNGDVVISNAVAIKDANQDRKQAFGTIDLDQRVAENDTIAVACASAEGNAGVVRIGILIEVD